MARKTLFILFYTICLFAGFGYYKFFSGKANFTGEEKYFYIHTNGANKQAVLTQLSRDSVVKKTADFEWLAARMGYWDHIKPGRYLIKRKASLFETVKNLRSGDNIPVKLIINKLRLPQDFAKLIGKNFETDSATVMNWLDSGRLEKFHRIIPNTYSIPWIYTTDRIIKKLNDDYEAWWSRNNRTEKATAIGFTPEQIYIIASIVEEETIKPEDKPKIASVYLNRLRLGMPLQADPTIKYALKNFKMTRILYADLNVASPYNTYRNSGLPPGPICTPSPATIDAVLNAPKTDYLFFVANADLMGGSTFTTLLKDHNRAAKEYQDSLTAWLKRKAAKAISDSLAKGG